MSILVIRQGFNQGATFRLGQRTLTMGRDKGNLVQVIDDKVSRRHALIRYGQGSYHLVDLQSSNGVYVNEERVREAALALHDEIRIGGTVLELIEDMHIHQDATLGRKVVDRLIIDQATRAVPAIGDADIARAEARRMIETDEVLADRDLQIHKFIYELSLAVTRGRPARECQEMAARGVMEHLSPDRLLVLELTGQKQAKRLVATFAADLPQERRRERAFMPALAQAVREAHPVLINELPAEEGRAAQLGSALAVPITAEERRVVGALYLDSFADNRKPYIEDDSDVLVRVGRALRGTFR